jgi:hypothetical protein
MTAKEHAPSGPQLEEWLGEKAQGYWRRVTSLIEELYPGVFAPEWLYGGKQHGWGLRFKKSRPLCTLIPEKNRLALLMVFGAKEREKVEAIRNCLSRHTLQEYDAAQIYHDGKWVVLTIDSDQAVRDLALLLTVKRKPRNSA